MKISTASYLDKLEHFCVYPLPRIILITTGNSHDSNHLVKSVLLFYLPLLKREELISSIKKGIGNSKCYLKSHLEFTISKTEHHSINWSSIINKMSIGQKLEKPGGYKLLPHSTCHQFDLLAVVSSPFVIQWLLQSCFKFQNKTKQYKQQNKHLWSLAFDQTLFFVSSKSLRR